MSVDGGNVIRRLMAVVMLMTLALLGGAPARAGDIEYDYDSAGRLISARYPNDTLVLYAYDAAGNRTRRLAESCVGPELAPTAVNDTMQVYILSWLNEENMTWWYYAFSDGAIDPLANDSDPSNYSLSVSWLSDAVKEPPFWITEGGALWYDSGEIAAFPPIVNSVQYRISNGHCQSDAATITINYQML